MLPTLLIALLAPTLAAAAVWPDTIGPWKRTTTAKAAVVDQALWNEYGLKEAETATYEQEDRSFTGTAYRLSDSTAALAVLQWLTPVAASSSALSQLAVTAGAGTLAAHGNFVFSFPAYQPSKDEYGALVAGLRNVDTTALPALIGFLPAANLVAGSQRYILGPVSLEKFAPSIPPSVAAFSMGAEAQLATYRSVAGKVAGKGNDTLSATQKLAVFNYPTPQIAMQRLIDFQNLPGLRAKRAGSLVAVVLPPADPDAAERLLGEVRYEAQITLNERTPTRKDNIGDLILNAFVLIGILLAFSTVAGLSFGAFRTLRRLMRSGPEPEAMITLHLENR